MKITSKQQKILALFLKKSPLSSAETHNELIKIREDISLEDIGSNGGN